MEVRLRNISWERGGVIELHFILETTLRYSFVVSFTLRLLCCRISGWWKMGEPWYHVATEMGTHTHSRITEFLTITLVFWTRHISRKESKYLKRNLLSPSGYCSKCKLYYRGLFIFMSPYTVFAFWVAYRKKFEYQTHEKEFLLVTHK